MSEEFSLYTGKLTYKDIDFFFSFDKEELRLTPPDDKKHTITFQWGMQEIREGVYTASSPVKVVEPWLIGECNETGYNIIFLPVRGSYLGIHNSLLRIEIAAYVICRFNRSSINRVSFSCPEINYIHPINQAYSLLLNADGDTRNGVLSITTRDFDSTSTSRQAFYVDDWPLAVYFGISRVVSTKISEQPLTLKSAMHFEFVETNDYEFIYRLWEIAKEFICFLCYRKNIYIPQVDISAPYKNGGHEVFATMYIVGQDQAAEQRPLQDGRYIKVSRLNGSEGEILSDITAGNIYMRHLPDTYESGQHIDAARFVMITAAFEWEFNRSYPKGIKRSQNTIDAEQAVMEEIQQQIEKNTGKKKKIYKTLKRMVSLTSMQTEVVQMSEDYEEIIGIFGKLLYRLNGQTLNYSEMGERLSEQRNHFAHGDLDKDFIGTSLLDLIFMERIIYAMQLKHYIIENITIQRVLNDLFHCNIAL